MKDSYHTFGEYMKKNEDSLTAAMEDYVEMLYRLSLKTGCVKIGELSSALNVRPPSATKMIGRLAATGYISYKKYGLIMLEDRGKEIGRRLIRRHEVIEAFMRLIGVHETEVLTETEKIEHTLSAETADCIERLTAFFSGNPDILELYKAYR
jgi:Mn-dependent DtxR family transcriptional regulator